MKKINLIVLISLVFFLLSACTPSSFYMRKGEQYFHHQQYKKAMRSLYFAAVDGDPEAQYAVGYMYYYGKGVIENHDLAHYWFEKSAENGNKEAKIALHEWV